MADDYVVKITMQAQEQMQETARYIADNLQAPETALRMLDTLEKEIASLSRFPNRIALTEEEPWRNYGVHKMPVKNYLIYFWIDEVAHKVQVTAAVYGKRDQMQQLSKTSF